jgi:hypothetical protein
MLVPVLYSDTEFLSGGNRPRFRNRLAHWSRTTPLTPHKERKQRCLGALLSVGLYSNQIFFDALLPVITFVCL